MCNFTHNCDSRGTSRTPDQYRTDFSGPDAGGIVREFTQNSDCGSPFGADFIFLETYIPWTNTTGGICWQNAFATNAGLGYRGAVKKRYETSGTTWSAWFAWY
jgi:hypothetical protein